MHAPHVLLFWLPCFWRPGWRVSRQAVCRHADLAPRGSLCLTAPRRSDVRGQPIAHSACLVRTRNDQGRRESVPPVPCSSPCCTKNS
ncbi:hypothetical protein LZ30DRAFT_716495 [Colletotrichum cereale]|nr:hypothetical protein LZ30DRAFT_716495 [Colletotrichum cereale]